MGPGSEASERWDADIRLADGYTGAYSPSGDAIAFFNAGNLYLREASTGTIRLLAGGPAGSVLTGIPWFNSDGTRIAFQRRTQPDHLRTDLYVYDRVARTTTLVTPDVGGNGGADNTPTDIDGFDPTNANRPLFTSMASNLMANDTNGRADIFVRDLGRRTTTAELVQPGAATEAFQAGLSALPATRVKARAILSLSLAIGMAQAQQFDQAATTATEALTVAGDQPIGRVRQRAEDLRQMLSPATRSAAVQEFDEKVNEYAGTLDGSIAGPSS